MKKKTEKKTTNKKHNPTPKSDLYKNLSRENNEHAQVWRFIDEYPKDLNATQAAIRAGYSKSAARQAANRLLSSKAVKAEIDGKMAEIARRNGFEQDDALRRWVQILDADLRKFCTVIAHCCRHCHDKDGRYQYLREEFIAAKKEHEQRQAEISAVIKDYKEKPFDERGGPTYDVKKSPNPECRDCGGHGIQKVIFKDLSQISPEDVKLFMGAERKEKGAMKVFLMDKMKALDALSRHVGFYGKDKEDGHTMPTKEELIALHNAMQDSIARNMEVIERRRAMLAEAREKMH